MSNTASANERQNRPALGRSSSFHTYSSRTSGLSQSPGKQGEDSIEVKAGLRPLLENSPMVTSEKTKEEVGLW